MKGRMPSLFLSVVRGYLWVILLLAVIAPVIFLSSLRTAFRDRATQDLIRSARALVPTVDMYLRSNDIHGMDSVLSSTSSALGARITVIGRDGTVYSDSEKDSREMENHRTRVEVISAFNGIPGSSSRNSATLDREMIYAAVPVFHGDSIPAVVRTSLFFESHSAMVSPVLARMLFIIAAAFIVAVVSAWLISRRISRPIADLAAVADRVTGGDLGARAAPGFTREQNALAKTLNQTLSKTEDLIGDLSSSNNRNRAILHSMSEGVVVVSPDDRILLVNRAFGSIFRLSRADCPIPGEVRQVFRRGHRGKSGGRLEYQGRVIAWTAAGVEGSGDSVFSFRDITREFNLSEIKRNFAVNVSHELRTPLTAIKGYAETLKEDSEGDAAGYLDVILRNTDRLIALVKDIQILSEVERDGSFLKLESTKVDDLLKTVLPLFQNRASSSGLDLSCVMDKPDLAVMADRYRVEQVLVNLIDNALKYTEEGRVEVRVSSRGSWAVIAVSDTGRGIPEDKQERIFERFYVVDRSRSRKMGGTGLGLAIAKHIVEAHGGSISVTSTPGQGSIFLFTLPLAD